MKIVRFSYIDALVSWLFVYFSSKLLWDTVPFIFELATLAVFAFCAISLVHSKPAVNLHRINLFITFLIFSFYVIANGILKDTFPQFARSLYEYIFYILILFAMMWLLPRADIQKCVKVYALFGLLIAVLSWWEFLTKSYLIADAVENYAGFRAMVFTRSYLSHGMILGLFSLGCMDISYRERKPLWFLAGVFCFISILTTSSRGPLVACGVALVFQFMMNAFISRRHSLKRLITCTILFAGAMAVFILMFGTFETPNETINNFLRRIRSIFNWTGDAGNVGRLLLWRQAFGWFKTNIWFGIGPSKTGSWGNGSIGVTESGVLKRFVELGIIGAVCFYYFIGCILLKGIRAYGKQTDYSKRQLVFWFSLVIAILINDIILQSTEEIMVSFYFWTAFAGIECASNPIICSQGDTNHAP